MKILIATNNKHKIDEYKKIFSPFNIDVSSLKEEHIICDPVENGETFEENSLIKAKECSKVYNGIILSDDSGLIVDALPDILGVHTSRFMGEDTPYVEKWKEVIKRLEGKNRSARFVCCITILNLDKEPLVFKGVVEGHIGYNPEGGNGFGYDPIFIPDGYDCSFAMMSEEQKNEISHRGRATKKMIEYLKEKFNENITN